MKREPITLEKGEDGIYRIPSDTKYENRKSFRYKHQKVHEFIAENGDKAIDFLEGMNRFIKATIQFSKLISPKK